MGKFNLLSTEVSKARALLAGGASVQQVLIGLRSWRIQVPKYGNHRLVSSLANWNESLCQTLQETLVLGTPMGRLLSAVQPMIRNEERHLTKLRSIERQFAFQGALAVVLPWGVVGATQGIEWSIFCGVGIVFQLLGLGAFYFLIMCTTKNTNTEHAWIFDFLVRIWMRVLSGVSLFSSIETVLKGTEPSSFSNHWQQWLERYNQGNSLEEELETWPNEMELSPQLAQLFVSLLHSGAPAAEILTEYMKQIDEEKQSRFEERLSALPVRLSLVFCAFFTPAVFLILFGALWPSLSILM